MLFGIIFSVVLGIVWLNLVIFLAFKSGFIYHYITKKGYVKEQFTDGSKRWLLLFALMVTLYMTICDMVVLGYNDRSFLVALLLNVLLILVLLVYNTYVINHWLLVVVRPMVFKISKMMTPVTIRSYTRFTWVYGGSIGLVLAMLSGWLYRIINLIVR